MYWLQNIGPALLASLWQSAIAYILLFAVRRSVHTTPNKTYILGISLQYILVGIFLYNVFGSSYAESNIASFYHINLLNKLILNNYISNTYISLLILNTAYFGINTLRSQRENVSKNNIVPDTLYQSIDYWKNKIGIQRSLKVVVQESVLTPFTKGFLKPTIVLPLSFINGLGTQQMEAILLHELWHIKRLDYLFLLIQICLEKIMYFNPFFLLIGKAIHEDRELSCDINTINSNNLKSINYIESLLFFSKENITNNTPNTKLAITGKHNSELVNRAAYLLEGRKNRTFQPSLSMNLMAIVALVLSLTNTGKSIPDLNHTSALSMVAYINKTLPLSFEKTSSPLSLSETKNVEKINAKETNNQVIRKDTDKKNSIKKKTKHNLDTSIGTVSDNVIASAHHQDNNGNSFVKMASHIQNADNGDNKISFKPIEINRQKAIFVWEAKGETTLEQAFNTTISNISNRFNIESSSFQYTAFSDSNQTIETSTTQLLSDNYRFVLVKGNTKILLAIIQRAHSDTQF